ncbi:peptidase M61 [Paucibacter sp. APW11]|uniref:Peptidase M61 n=1 Tax=Roseateles aquae TaxID=3077235 RepID=A0ABU3PFV5_9BURK|nr:PDZ domain-containing protein [Paucibacter sp. APW11]MDT9001227.1 peptidase M61 [Paucibacter sp. APW11]
MIHYKIEIADVHAHLYRVTLTLPAPAAEQRLSLPVWIPGSYMVREFSRHLSGFSARQGRREIDLQQLDKCSWLARCSGKAALVLSYQVYAFDTSVRAAFLDAERGFFNGTGLCLRAEGREAEAHQIELAGLPAGWQVASGMREIGKRRYEAADYDELVDHPFELGRFWRGRFEARGVAHEFVVAGALPSFDGERLLADSRRICEAQIDFWHAGASKPPFDRYVFLLNAVDDSYGGLEHRASTALIAARRDLPRLGQGEMNEGYARLLGLISHEYFHTWNVKRLRPDVFARFDYSQENYTELLWFFEGFTSYYDDLFLVRAGLIDEARYLKLIAATFSGVLGVPGLHRMSVAQSSFEAWTKYYRQDENSPNAITSYYTKGSMIAMALDLTLRTAAKPRATLDSLMRALWQRSGGGGPVSEQDILQTLAQLGGAEAAEKLAAWVHGTGELPLPQLLEQLGLQWKSDKQTLAQRLGLRVSDSGGSINVKQVLQGSAAMAAGVCAGDEILASNGWRLKRLDDAALTLGGERQPRLQLLVCRDQRMLTLEALLPEQGPCGLPVKLSAAEKSTPRAARLRRDWLGG